VQAFQDDDYLRYLTNLREASLRYGVAIHAYALMTNHVHLLATPAEVGAVSRVMQTLGRLYVPYVNVRYRRTGTLWEGRCKSCLVDSGDYLLRCYRYIELNPVRAAMVAAAADYRWSSHRANAFGEDDPLVTPHRDFLALDRDPVERRAVYQSLFVEAMSDDAIAEIRSYLGQQRALGSERFQRAIERALGRCASVRPAHRPARRKAL
jgi:putative transposase